MPYTTTSSTNNMPVSQVCVECVRCRVDEDGCQIYGTRVLNPRIQSWVELADVTLVVAGTGYCLPHGLEAYKRSQQYVINEY